MRLFASPASPYSRKVRIVLAEKRIECEIEMVDPLKEDNPAVAHNPLGKVPTLLLEDGTAIYDSRVIVEFLDHVSPISRLIPEENRERIAVFRWQALADGVLDAGSLLRMETLRPKKEQSETWMARQRAKIERGLARMAHDLGERAWCHHDKYSLADIALGCCLAWIEFRKPGGIEWRGEFPSLARHLDKLAHRQAFADTAPR